MISGGVKHCGGAALARHLLNEDHNEAIELGARRAVLSGSLTDAIQELRTGSRSRKPLYHVHIDPVGERQAEQAERFWHEFEKEFNLSDHAFIEVAHEKAGRRHWHRIYDRTGPDGRLVGFGHDFARREKIARRIEYEFDQQLIPGRHSRAVVARLNSEGDRELAAQLSALPTPAPGAAVSPAERQQSERTGWSRTEAEAEVLAAWLSSDDAKAFRQSLLARGLALAQGDKVPVVTNSTGDVWPVARLLGAASHCVGTRVSAAAVHHRLEGVALPDIRTAGALLSVAVGAEPSIVVGAVTSQPSAPPQAGELPAPPLDRAGHDAPLRGAQKAAFQDKKEAMMSPIDHVTQAKPGPRIRLVPTQAVIGELDPADLSPYEKQKRAQARAEKHKAQLLNKRYSTDIFKSDPLVRFIKEDPTEGVLRVSLRTGQHIIDEGEKIELVGAINGEAVKRCMQICEAKNWQRIVVSGPQEFRDLMWAEGQRRGVTLANHSPSAETIKAYTLELEARWRQESDAAPPPSTEADRAAARAADLEIEPQKQPPMAPPVRRVQERPAAPAIDLAARRDQIARQIGTARLSVADLRRRAREAEGYA
jgi:hypothetical protein